MGTLLGASWRPKQVTTPTDPQFENWGWCPPLQGFPHSWGRCLWSAPPGWVLRSHKSLGSSPVLALVFRLVCGDNGQGRRMTQVRGKVEWLAGAKLAHGGAGCWLGSEEPWVLWSNAVVSLCLGFEDTYGLG